jgi:stearoyl-CoA desaturase (delta-9 desaturase)
MFLPVHFVMGPVHGAIVNWCGHRNGYKNFACDDDAKNTLLIDFVTLGELFQNNHHRFAMSPRFSVRWFEIDPAWQVIRLMALVGIVDLGKRPQFSRWSPADRLAEPAPASDPERAAASLAAPAPPAA